MGGLELNNNFFSERNGSEGIGSDSCAPVPDKKLLFRRCAVEGESRLHRFGCGELIKLRSGVKTFCRVASTVRQGRMALCWSDTLGIPLNGFARWLAARL